MTPQEALIHVVRKTGAGVPHTIWDFGSFYLFAMAPADQPKDESYDIGTVMTAVDKANGRVYDYDITSNLGAFENAKVITI